VDAGCGDNDGPVAVHELTPSFGIAETYGKWQGRCEPLDCFAHVGVVQYGHHGGIWCGAVLLQHRIGGYHCFPAGISFLITLLTIRVQSRLTYREENGIEHLSASEIIAPKKAPFCNALQRMVGRCGHLEIGYFSNFGSAGFI
jgi:hypothetical protein